MMLEQLNQPTKTAMYQLVSLLSADVDQGTHEQIQAIVLRAIKDAQEKRREYFDRKQDEAA